MYFHGPERGQERFNKAMIYILVGVIIISIISMKITRYFGLYKWQVQVALLVLAIVLYVTNILLTKHYIKKRAPYAASSEEVIPGVQAWELTAGLGIVPKWVSFLGLFAISAVISAIIPWIITLINLIFG